jgi:hypothetical protein
MQSAEGFQKANHTMKHWLLTILTLASCAHEAPPAPPPMASAAPSANAMIVSSDAGPIADDARIHDNSMVVALDGFMRSCADRAEITVESGKGGTRIANQTLPAKGNYFLDGKYVGAGMGCDLVVCARATDQKIALVEYQSAGSITKPNATSDKEKAAAFQSVDLTGNIHIEIKYFADAQCKTPKVFSKDVRR